MQPNRPLSRKAAAAVICFAALVGLAIPTSAYAETTLQRAQREGVLRIGFANEPPWGFMKPDGTLTGESPEILKALAGSLGVKRIEGVLVEFGSLIPGLQAQRFDVIATALYIRPARCTQVAFTNPTVAVGMGLLVQKGNPLGLHSYEDIAHKGAARIALVTGMTPVSRMTALFKWATMHRNWKRCDRDARTRSQEPAQPFNCCSTEPTANSSEPFHFRKQQARPATERSRSARKMEIC